MRRTWAAAALVVVTALAPIGPAVGAAGTARTADTVGTASTADPVGTASTADNVGTADTASTGGGRVSVIVTFAAPPDARHEVIALASRAANGVGAQHIGAVAPFASVAAATMEVDAGQVESLRRQAGVVDVAPNRLLHALSTDSNAQIGAPAAWSGGLTGAGKAVAVIDTGVDGTHPMLAGKVVNEACFTPNRPGLSSGYCKNGATSDFGVGSAAPCTGSDQCPHGTHVSSVAVGNGDGRLGVAPDAKLIAVQVFTSAADPSEGIGTDEATVVRALEWVYSQRGLQSIAAVNLSLGGDPLPTPCSASAAMMSIIDQLNAAGIAVVVAGGNDGTNSRLGFPACLPNVVSVGSVDARGNVSAFSDVAPGLSLVAPGEVILGAWISPGYMDKTGTSFSAPQVSAAFALLRQQLPSWPVPSLVALLRRTGDVAFMPRLGSFIRASNLRIDRATRGEFQVDPPFTFAPDSPLRGALDDVSRRPGGIRVAGWALDPDSVAPMAVHVYIDGAFVASTTARVNRPDIAAAFAGYGPAHGYDTIVPAGVGAHSVCTYGIDLGPGAGNVLLGCSAITVGGALGAFDAASSAPGGVRVSGWALDTKTASPAFVHVYLDGSFATAFTAATKRPDIGAVFPGYGAGHGFDAFVPTGGGVHTVCAYAIELATPNPSNPLLGCRDVLASSGSPIGALDVVAATFGAVRVAGWALDPDTTAPIAVHVYVDAVGVAATASVARPDVAVAFAGYGSAHGFDVTVQATPGVHGVCVYGINVGDGDNALLSCRVVAVPDGSPFGALDSAVITNGTLRVSGWAVDPDAPGPSAVHVYVDGAFAASITADKERPDVAAAVPGAGPAHGYVGSVPVAPGKHTACTYALNVGAGASKLLGCALAG